MGSGLAAIEKVVVLMFENRSFDHILGALPGVNGVLDASGNVKSDLYNLPDPTQPPSQGNLPVPPTGIDRSDQAKKIPHDFNHDLSDGMMPDLFGPGTTGYVAGKPIGAPVITYPTTNSGFISSLYFPDGKPPRPAGPSAMTYFNLGQLQVLHTLAEQFVVCDNWFCDMPGHTMVNRLFMHCATTGNLGINDPDEGICNSKTIFELIEEQGRDWRMYTPQCGQVDSRFLNENIQTSPYTNIFTREFAEDLQNGTLPFYSFVMCWSCGAVSNDTSIHPASYVESGENYLAAIYNALRASPKWNQTLLIVTFDENGGIYDHVPPPAAVQPVEGDIAYGCYHGICSKFDFSLLGPRIPVILISPWLAPGIDSTQYQNTSILRLLEDLMTPPTKPPLFLTGRDQTATSIARAFDQFGLAAPRDDCPGIPTYSGYPFADGLIDPTCCDGEAAEVTLAPHMAEVAKIYAGGQPGHADSGKSITRKFTTFADLTRYMRQRDQAARWFNEGVHLKASTEIVETAPGQWIWRVKNADGDVLAAPPNPYATRELALKELDRLRFLLNELCCTP